ncbi:phytoene desaturase [Clostridium beijerinckii]|nr:phytoene desaturase [Clostridium beijerinckii]
MNKKAIVIGSGLGGLSISARLLSKGFKVKIFEKNLIIGGKTNLLSHDDFKFDLTASLLMFYKDYIEIFDYCNKNYKNYFSLIPLNPLYKVFFNDQSVYKFPNDLSSLSLTLSEITNNDVKQISGYFNFLSYSYEKYNLSNKYFLNKSFIKQINFFNPLTLCKGLELHPLPSAYKCCRKYIYNKKLLHYLMFQTMYIGVSPYESSNIYNAIPAVSQIEGLYHIEGGMYSYIKALEKLILEQDGTIYTSSPVDEILFDNNKAVGVVVNGKKIDCDIVICSSDYSYTIDNLIKDKEIKKFIKPVKDMDYSCSTFILYLALNKKYPTLEVNNIYINKNFKNNINSCFKGELSIDPSLYIYCPSAIDSTVCPSGCETINVIVRVPNLLEGNIIWNVETIKNMSEKLLNILSSIKGVEDIREHILFQDYLTPVVLKDNFNTYGGSAFALSHTLKQTNIFRPQCEIPHIKNLFFTGASIHPGNGVSMVIKSSKICMDNILKVL